MNDKATSFESKIEELRKELDHFREKRDDLNLEARRWAQKRDRIHKDFKELLAKKSSTRERYRAVNERINILKEVITEAREERRKKKVQLRILKGKLRDLRARGSYARSEDLKAEMEDLEWRIQTTPLQLEEEKRLVEDVRFLETQLAIHSQIEKLGDDQSSLKDRMDAAYNEVSELYEQKAKTRDDIVEFSKKLDEFKIKADGMHGKYLECKDEARKFHLMYVDILNQIRSLEEELDKMEQKRRAERTRELKKDLEKKALKKLDGRKRLTLEELKILAEKGKI
jgi:uncharacterized coiled-coil DUF342 family protein